MTGGRAWRPSLKRIRGSAINDRHEMGDGHIAASPTVAPPPHHVSNRQLCRPVTEENMMNNPLHTLIERQYQRMRELRDDARDIASIVADSQRASTAARCPVLQLWSGIGARAGQRAAFHPTRLQSDQVDRLDEVGQLSHRRRRAFRLPTHLNTACHRLHSSIRHKHFFALRQLQFRLTHRVTPLIVTNPRDCLSFRQIARHQLSFLGSMRV